MQQDITQDMLLENMPILGASASQTVAIVAVLVLEVDMVRMAPFDTRGLPTLLQGDTSSSTMFDDDCTKQQQNQNAKSWTGNTGIPIQYEV